MRYAAQDAARIAQFLDRDALRLPFRWRSPRRVFVCGMTDLFLESHPWEWIDEILAVMAAAPQHIYQVLTKRPQRMRDWTGRLPGAWVPLPNVWLGVSAEDQRTARRRIPVLLGTPAAVRFLSAEPLPGPIDLSEWVPGRNRRNGGELLDWVIVGGESGPGARPMHPDWVRQVRDRCRDGGTPFFLKQWGEHGHDGRRVGKRAAGRLLDGREWNGMPAGYASRKPQQGESRDQ